MSRAMLLLVCVIIGATVGTAGWLLGESQLWFLAVPAIIAAGWLVVADPTRCLPESEGKARSGRGEA